MQRFIFDIDGTILEEDYSNEVEFFKSILTSDEAEKFIPKIGEYVEGYEAEHNGYNVGTLSKYLTFVSNIDFTPEIIYKWREVVSNYDPKVVPGASDFLYYLWGHSKSIVGLSNWFGDDQLRRLEKADLLKYFDDFYGGDFYMKPSRESYLNAAGRYDLKDCIVIGDSLENDVYGPYRAGMDAYYYDKKGKNDYNKKLVKSFRNYTDLMRRF